MEGRHCVAILLLIFAVIEVYSNPLNSPVQDEDDAETQLNLNNPMYYHYQPVNDSSKPSIPDLLLKPLEGPRVPDLSVKPFESEVQRVRRDKSGVSKPKNTQQAARNLDRRLQIERHAQEEQARREREEREQRFRNIIDGYMAQGMSRGQALMQANRDHPELADRVFST
ncbi:uncharacterized protein [Venturia canescens]|uniref:uncharacterized protein n=1 Tax=Venturia canescens TaxID=32260 RepID=UPI001C9C19FC|nr:uncharacterized protein LOC122415979 [Venturia canescens]